MLFGWGRKRPVSPYRVTDWSQSFLFVGVSPRYFFTRSRYMNRETEYVKKKYSPHPSPKDDLIKKIGEPYLKKILARNVYYILDVLYSVQNCTCIFSPVSSLSYVSWLMSPVSCLLPHVSCLMFPASYLTFSVSSLTSPVSHLFLMSHVSCLTSPV